MEEKTQIKLVVGLGNPGECYVKTRHNIGFQVLDELSKAQTAWKLQTKWSGIYAQWGNQLLLKPQTSMNLSGDCVAKVLRFHRWKPAQVLLVYDDVDLPFGTLRFRTKGGSGGHNGVKSIMDSLGTEEIPRLKLGIGRVNSRRLSSYVLSSFSRREKSDLQKTLIFAGEAIQVCLQSGISFAANQYNEKDAN